MNMKRYKVVLCCLAVFVLPGCNSWLDLQPENEQSIGSFWNNKEEVEDVVSGAYVQLRNCVEDFIIWGELRADVMILGPKTDYTNYSDMNMIRELEIRPANKVTKWNRLYSVIGRCNSVIKYAPTVVPKDDTFEQSVCDSYLAEVIWLRSLCYFYLVRTFKDVPLVFEPYMTDEQDFNVPKSTDQEVLDQIVKDLNAYVKYIKPGYDVEWQDKGWVTRYAYYALLADIYLWRGEYDKVLEMCRNIENSGRFTLLSSEQWYELYYPGNSAESIFEIQWSSTLGQGNELYNWFLNDDNAQKYAISENAKLKYSEITGETDVRGLKATFLEKGKIWKYAGTAADGTSKRGTDQRDANWIIYRYADIMLMKAEALVMKGGEENLAAAYQLVVSIRERAGYSTYPDEPTDEYDALQLVMEERMREFAFEGKRWFDLVRMAVRDNGKYKNNLIQSLLANIAAKERPFWQEKLQDPNGYYLPIFQTEIENSKGILVQNPYYEGM